MEEILRNIGVRVETWFISLFASILFILYRIFEPDQPPATRRVISIIIMGLISALLVPGLVVHWFNITNAFVAATVTGITVYGFEQVVSALRKMLINKIDKHGNE